MLTQANKIKPSHNYLIGLDGLRACSILLVMIAHFGLGHIVPGGFGVTVFFFISGFLITRLLLVEYEIENKISISSFYIRRTFRIIPAMLVFVIVAELIWLFWGQSFNSLDVLSTVFFGTNYYKLYVGYSDFISSITEQVVFHPFKILWSLAVEEHYYLVFPLIFSLMILSKRKFISFLIVASLFALGLRIYYVFSLGLTIPFTYYSTETRLDAILIGSLFSIFTTFNKFNRFILQTYFFWIGLILICGSLVYRDPAFRETFRYTIQSIGIALVIFNILFNSNSTLIGLFRNLLDSKVFIYIGKISYSLYLYHWLGLLIANYYFIQFSPLWLATCYSFSFLAAHLSYIFVEKVAIRFRKHNFK
jgi:peptidoglycan/LPS O-acetylase OafA/YrhL